VSCIFRERRKKAAGLIAREYNIPKETAENLLGNPNARAEELSFEKLVEITKKLNT